MSGEIWAVIHHADETALGIVQKAAALAEEKGFKAAVLLVEKNTEGHEINSLSQAGAQRIFVLEADTDNINRERQLTEIIAELIERHKPEAVLFEYSMFFSTTAPAVAARLRTGITADCTELRWDEVYGLLQIRPTFGGRRLAVNRSRGKPALCTVRRGVFGFENPGNSSAKPELNIIKIPKCKESFAILEEIEKCLPKDKLSTADIIISGGAGMGSRENFEKLYKIAELMGASIGASRAAVAAGFAPYSHQIGLTGVSVRPKLYIALGISGAVQHLSGILNAEKIFAVNSDPRAAIHDFSDFSLIYDCNTFADRLLDKLNNRKW